MVRIVGQRTTFVQVTCAVCAGQQGTTVFCIQVVVVVLCGLGARSGATFHQIEVTQYNAHGEHTKAAVANMACTAVLVILGETVDFLYKLHVDEFGTEQVYQVAGIGSGVV